MAQDTTLLHVSDTHLGKRQYQSDVRRDDFARAFDATADIAVDRDVDAVIHTGDLFDSPRPNTRAISQAVSTVRKLEENEIPFLAIVGNHERKLQEQWLDIFAEFDYVDRLSEQPTMLNNVAIYGIDAVRGPMWESHDFTLETGAEPDSDDSLVRVLCMHELFEELVPPQQADHSVETVIDRLTVEPEIIALGDFHGARSDSIRDTKIFYAGSTERMSVSEGGPTVREITVEGDTPTTKILDVGEEHEDIPRPFYTKTLSLTDSTTATNIREQLNEIPADLTDSVIAVTLSGAPDSPISRSDVYEIMAQLDVKVAHVTDKRRQETFAADAGEIPDTDDIDIESRIDDAIDDDVDSVVSAIDSAVRDTTIPKSELRDHVSEQMGETNED